MIHTPPPKHTGILYSTTQVFQILKFLYTALSPYLLFIFTLGFHSYDVLEKAKLETR